MSKWRRLWHTVQQDTYHIKKKNCQRKEGMGYNSIVNVTSIKLVILLEVHQ